MYDAMRPAKAAFQPHCANLFVCERVCMCVPHATRDVSSATGHSSPNAETSRESNLWAPQNKSARQMCETMHNSKSDNNNNNNSDNNNNNIIIFYDGMQSPLIEFTTIIRITEDAHEVVPCKYDKCNQKVIKQKLDALLNINLYEVF